LLRSEIKAEQFELPLPIKVQIAWLSVPRRSREARERVAQRTPLVREQRRLPMNAIFEAE